MLPHRAEKMNELTFKGSDSIQAVAWLASYVETLQADKRYTITVKEKKERRSLSANNYFWVMVDGLAAKIGIPKETIYRSYIKEIGDNNTMVCVQNKAVDKLIENWKQQGLGYVCEKMDSKLEGCTNVILYYGSHTYNQEQMSRLIMLAKQDCIEHGVPTYDEKELESMLAAWDNK